MKTGSERTEYRVQFIDETGVETTWGGLAFEQRKLAEKALSMAARDSPARIQQRVIGPWTDIDQEGSQDG